MPPLEWGFRIHPRPAQLFSLVGIISAYHFLPHNPKQYRRSVNQWSYGRLIENVESQAAKVGIAIEESKQPIRGSPQNKAKELAFTAYKSRQKS